MGGDGFLLNHFDQKLLTCTCLGYRVNRFLYRVSKPEIICKGRRKRNESCEKTKPLRVSTLEMCMKETSH